MKLLALGASHRPVQWRQVPKLILAPGGQTDRSFVFGARWRGRTLGRSFVVTVSESSLRNGRLEPDSKHVSLFKYTLTSI